MSLLAFSDSAIQLVPDGTLLFHLALIVVMVALLNVTLLRPINRILEERERRTKGRMGEAQRILADLDERTLEYQRRLREARGTGYLLLEEERTAASRHVLPAIATGRLARLNPCRAATAAAPSLTYASPLA